jgi:hypothetical protein
MANNSKKLSQLPVAANAAPTDRLVILRDPLGNSSARTIAFSTLGANISFSNAAPANSTSNGVAGTIAYDQTHLYICTAKNNWKRVVLETW